MGEGCSPNTRYTPRSAALVTNNQRSCTGGLWGAEPPEYWDEVILFKRISETLILGGATPQTPREGPAEGITTGSSV